LNAASGGVIVRQGLLGVREAWMSIRQELAAARQRFRLLSLYQRFEHIIVTILTALIAVIVWWQSGI
jgi:hypothetical protein